MKRKLMLVTLLVSLFISITTINYAQDNKNVEVTIFGSDIELNGTLINNQHNKYPIIVYKNIFYLPLSEGYSRTLGLATSLYEENGIVISSYYKFDAPIQDLSENNDLNSKYYAKILDSKITIDEKEIINSQEEYPFLTFRDIVYIPITKRFADEFGWKVSLDEENRLSGLTSPSYVYDTTIVDDWIYFCEDYKMYKMKLDGSEKTMFADSGISYQMIVNEDWIYYINGSDESKLYKIKIDGTKKTKLSDKSISYLIGIDDYIYYTKEDDYSDDNPSSVYKMNLDGKKDTIIKNLNLDFLSFPLLKDGWIYYKNIEDYYNLYKIMTNGNNKTKIVDSEISHLQIIDNWIYYVDISDYNLYKVKFDGSKNTKIVDEKIFDCVIDKDWVYYSNEEDNGNLYKIKLDGSGKRKLNNDRSDIVEVLDEWVYYKNYYGELIRINTNNETRQFFLLNKSIKYYYIDGEKVEENKSGEWLLNNLKLSYLNISENLESSIEIIKPGSSNISFVEYNSGYSDISLHKIKIDKQNKKLIYISDRQNGSIMGLQSNDKYIKWEELYQEGTEYFVDVYAYEIDSNKKILIKEKINCSLDGGFYRIHTTLDDNYVVWLENHQDENKSYIKLYSLNNIQEKTLDTVDFTEKNDFQKIPVTFVDMDGGKIIFDKRENDGYYYNIYDIEKESIIKHIKVTNNAVVHFSADYDSKKELLGVYFRGEDENGYYEEVGYVDINSNDYNKIYRLKNNEIICKDRIQLKNYYLAYNIQKNVSGYICNHYFGYITNLENKEIKELKGSFEVKIYEDHIGNISFDRETNGAKINYEIMNINEIFNIRKKII